jgi:type II secretory pathway component GspD/PulD (secretin)
MVSVGTMIRATPQIEEGGTVLVKLELERTRLVAKPRAEGASESEPSRTVSTMAKSMIRVPPGQTVLMSGAKSFANDETTELLIIVSAQVSDAPKVTPKANTLTR